MREDVRDRESNVEYNKVFYKMFKESYAGDPQGMKNLKEHASSKKKPAIKKDGLHQYQ